MEMGNPNEATLWDRGQVYINRTNSLDAPQTADDLLSLNWEAVGLIEPNQGLTETKSSTSTEVPLWNHPPREKSRDHKLTFTFTAQSTNPIVNWLRYSGSSDQDLAAGILKVGPARHVYLAWEVLEGDRFERKITREKVQVDWTGASTASNQSTENTEFSAPMPSEGLLQQVRGVILSS